jgi:hypothetical protein
MAGLWNPVPVTIFDNNGAFATGALVYFYLNNSSTPIIAYSDSGLTTPLTWPVVASNLGVFPPCYLPYGNYRRRITDQYGTLISDTGNIDNIGPVITPAIDPTTLFQTGFPIWLMQTAQISGFVRMYGNTIGSASSGATELASSTAVNLFAYLWNNFSNVIAPVSTGRGATPAADFTANKTIVVPSMQQCVALGWDGVTLPGVQTGANSVALAIPNLPSHTHVLTDPGHTHNQSTPSGAATYTGAGATFALNNGTSGAAAPVSSSPTGITIANTGSGTAFSTLPQGRIGQWYMKI